MNTDLIIERNKYLKNNPVHQSETTKRYLIKNIEASNLSGGDKRTLIKLVRSQ